MKKKINEDNFEREEDFQNVWTDILGEFDSEVESGLTEKEALESVMNTWFRDDSDIIRVWSLLPGEYNSKIIGAMKDEIRKELADFVIDGPNESYKGNKTMKKKINEEYGPLQGEYYMEEIAHDLEIGSTYRDTDEYSWSLLIDGMEIEESISSNEVLDWLCYEISYPVRDGHDYYNGLNLILDKDRLDYENGQIAHDLERLGFDTRLFEDTDEIQTWIDYDLNLEVHENEDDMEESYKGRKTMKKRMNEISDELKQKVLDKRKAQADKANAKLNRANKLVANSGSPALETVTVTFTSGFCDTEEDVYEEGATGSYGSTWDNDKQVTFELNLTDPNFAKTLAEKAGEYLYCYWVGDDINNINVVKENNQYSLRFSVMGNVDNEEPSEQDYEDWKKGETRLWIIDGFISLKIDPNEAPYFMKALEKAGVYTEEWNESLKSSRKSSRKMNEGNFDQQSTAWYDICKYVKERVGEDGDYEEAVWSELDDLVYTSDIVNVWTNMPGNLGSRTDEITDLMREDIREGLLDDQEWVMGLDESLKPSCRRKSVNENRWATQDEVSDDEYLDTYEYIYSSLVNGNISQYKKQLKRLQSEGALRDYEAWANEMGVDPRIVRFLESHRPSRRRKSVNENKNYMGLEGIETIWHGQWSDPEITYQGHTFNYWDVEEALYNMCKEDIEEGYFKGNADNDEDFARWVQENTSSVYGMLDDWIAFQVGESLKPSRRRRAVSEISDETVDNALSKRSQAYNYANKKWVDKMFDGSSKREQNKAWKEREKASTKRWNAEELAAKRKARKSQTEALTTEEEQDFRVVRKNAKANPNLYGGRYTQKSIKDARAEYEEDIRARKSKSESLASSILKSAHEALSMNESNEMTTWSFTAKGFQKAVAGKQSCFGTSDLHCVIHENKDGVMSGVATLNYEMPKTQVEEAIVEALRQQGFRTTTITELTNLY